MSESSITIIGGNQIVVVKGNNSVIACKEDNQILTTGSKSQVITQAQSNRIISTPSTSNVITKIEKRVVVSKEIKTKIIQIGTQGIPGVGIDKNFLHNQNVPATEWGLNGIITHGLNKTPSVTVLDSAGTEVEGDVQNINLNQVRLVFSAPFSGKASFN